MHPSKGSNEDAGLRVGRVDQLLLTMRLNEKQKSHFALTYLCAQVEVWLTSAHKVTCFSALSNSYRCWVHKNYQ